MGIRVAVLGMTVCAALHAVPASPAWQRGGSLTVAASSEPVTLNPVFAVDNASRLAVSLMMADLMHINAATQKVEPALARGVTHSRDDLHWTVHLRPGLRFSDGAPLTAADVVFSFQVYTDPALAAPQRDLLLVHDRPIQAQARGELEIELTLPGRYAVGDRLFDSLWILPRHKLEALYRAGRLAQAWGLNTPFTELVGAGPFLPVGYQPGRLLRLQRNPYFWQHDAAGEQLPYLDAVSLVVLPDPEAQVALFGRHQVDVVEKLRPEDIAGLAGDGRLRVLDAGPSLEPLALIFNLNQAVEDAQVRRRQKWFQLQSFRQAVSLAIDRAGLVRAVFGGRGAPLTTLTSPAETLWAEPGSLPTEDLALARQKLQGAGFHWQGGELFDAAQTRVTFSLIVPSSNQVRVRAAVFLQEDLRRLGLDVRVVPLEFRSYVERLLHRKDYDAALLGLGFPDADPNVEMSVWTLDGAAHYWNLHPSQATSWEREMDRLIRSQAVASNAVARRTLYRRLQEIEREELPMIPLVAPDVLVGMSAGLMHAQAALLAPHALWNVQQLAWQRGWL